MSLKHYVSAIIPEPYTICGLRLKPFCLGHYLLMKKFQVSYANDSEARTNPVELVKDFLLALVICSLSYEEFLEAVTTDKLMVNTKQFRFFGKRVEKEMSFRKWLSNWGDAICTAAKDKDNFNALEKISAFRKYLNDGLRVPLFYDEGKDNQMPSGAHWSQSIEHVLTGELGYTHSEALNLPLAKALSDYFKYAERHGLVTLMTDEEIELTETNQGIKA